MNIGEFGYMSMLKLYTKWELRRNKTFLKLLEYNPSARVIDLGCGFGDFTLTIKNEINCNTIWGVDIWKPALMEAKNKGIKTVRCNLNNTLPFKDESYDVVVSNQVIEHLLYPIQFLKEIFRILKYEAYAIISTENLASYDNILALLLGYTPFSINFDEGMKIGNPLSPHNKKRSQPNYPPHLRIFSIKGLIDATLLVGFTIDMIVASGHILGYWGDIIDKRHARFITLKMIKER